MRKSQVSIEYMIIVGFVVLIVIAILGIALVYSGSVKDRIRTMDLSNCAGKIISESESVFYSGYPSRTTVPCYLPEGINQIDIIENSLVFEFQTNSGVSRTSFSSKVPISGNIPAFSGTRKIRITAEENYTSITLL